MAGYLSRELEFLRREGMQQECYAPVMCNAVAVTGVEVGAACFQKAYVKVTF